MGQMHKPWPDAPDAVAMPVDELALRVLDRLANTPNDPYDSLLRRASFVNREVTEYEGRRRHVDNLTTVTTSDEALVRHPALARAYGEAWDLAVARGWLADDPQRPGSVYVTGRGEQALAAYRADDSGGGAEPVGTHERPARAAVVPPSPVDEAPGDEAATRADSPSRLRSLLYDQWTVGIGTALVAGVFLALLLSWVR